MRRCTSCFRFQPGSPTFCSYCGRSFNVRICSRGHHNPRGVEFCSECGSADLSTPAPRASFLFHLSGAVLYLLSGLLVLILMGSAALSLFYLIDWQALSDPILMLVLMLGVLYWTTTLLPGPIRRIGRAAGRMAWRSMKQRNKRNGKH
jgi:hypothetical protein